MENLEKLSSKDLTALLAKKRKEEQEADLQKRQTYEAIKAETVAKMEDRLRHAVSVMRDMYDFVSAESGAFYEIMKEYGELRNPAQKSFHLKNENFRVDVKISDVSKFDERGDIAAARLREFFQEWIKNSEKGEKDPMYKLAMTMISRNKDGDLDHKSISKLRKLEDEFMSEEYSKIMKLFTEAEYVEGTASNIYFSERTPNGDWCKIEPSFNRM